MRLVLRLMVVSAPKISLLRHCSENNTVGSFISFDLIGQGGNTEDISVKNRSFLRVSYSFSGRTSDENRRVVLNYTSIHHGNSSIPEFLK